MFFLADFDVIRPDFGLLFWTSIIFILFWLLIGKFAFKPIAEALKKRENDIQSALDEAKNAKLEMANLKSENEALLAQAREERAAIIKEAKEAKNAMINEAREKAKEEASRITSSAMLEIENQKKAAITEVKNQVGGMAVEIAEKILKRELSGGDAQSSYVSSLVDEINLN